MVGGRWARRLAELAGWSVTAAVGAVMLTQAVGFGGSSLLATIHALTPYSLPLIAVVAATAGLKRSLALALTAAVVGSATLVLAFPIAFPASQPSPRADATELRAASINLLFSNPVVADVADDLADRDLDVVVFIEYTVEHADTLLIHPLADRFPYKINRDGVFGGGMAMWSRFPIEENDPEEPIDRTIDATLKGPDGDVFVLAVHPPTPIHDLDGWRHDLGLFGEVADAADDPTLVIGDFNASWWHPAFRDLLDRDLFDAHMANGRGWSTSWPTDEPVPPFVRLDHALTGNGLVSTGVTDFRIPGSDHEGFVVTVTMAS